MCTSRARAMDANYFSVNDIVNGACCPEDAVPCNFNKPEHRCMENPKNGVVEYLPEFTRRDTSLYLIMYRTHVPGKSPYSVSQWCHVHK